MKLRELLEQISDEIGIEVSVTVNPGTRADEVLDLDLWLVNYEPTPRPIAMVHQGVVYFTNPRKEEG